MQVAAPPALCLRQSQIMAHRLEMWMDRQRAPKAYGGLAMLADRHVAKTLPGGSAEVIGISRQRFLAVSDGTRKISPHETDRSALIPTFGEAWSRLDHTRKCILRFLKLALLHSIYSGAENPIDFSIS